MVAKLAMLAASLPGIYIEGVFSHFATADADDKQYAAYQFARFQEALRLIEAEGVHIPIRHIANSAALTELEEYQLDMVRQGITLYGLHPAHMIDCYKNFEPVMTVKTQVSFVKTLPAGDSIGYGRSFTTARPSVIATVPIGYADGVSRLLSNKGYMIINGEQAPIVGRVCMDQLMVDVTHIPETRLEDTVILIGKSGDAQITVEQIAAAADSFNYELVCGISRRVPRIYVSGGQVVNEVRYLLDN